MTPRQVDTGRPPERENSPRNASSGGGELLVNGEKRALPPVATLQGLLEDIGMEAPDLGLAVIRNGAVVRRADWATTSLAPNDELEIVRATVGG